MDILFINPNNKAGLNQEVNGTMLLGTILIDAGFEVGVLRFYEIEGYKTDYNQFLANIVNRIVISSPNVVSFYSLWPDYHVTLRIAREVKQCLPNVYIVLAGPHPSVCAFETMKFAPYVDYICTGEGECSVIPFFDSLLRNDKRGMSFVPGVFYRSGGVVLSSDVVCSPCELNFLPYWNDNLYLDHVTSDKFSSKYYFMPIDVGRGCPFSCTYCTCSLFWKRNYRLKSPDRIISEIRYYYDKFGIKSFRFSHDAFTVNRKLVEEICDRIIEENLDIVWVCTSRIDCITEDLILKMKSAGMIKIEMGVESGSARIQKIINKKLNLDRVKPIVRYILDQKIDVVLFFMFGFPQETEEDLADTLSLQLDMLDLGVSRESMALCRFAPGTKLTNEFLDELVFDSSVIELRENVFGYEEELEVIKSNKTIFSMFYHLDTDVRNKYQYLRYFLKIYQKFPNSIRHLRKKYNGDNLRMYRDFYNNNLEYFNNGIECLSTAIEDRPLEMIYNVTRNFTDSWIPQLEALLKYDRNVQVVSKSKEDIEIRDVYAFSYIDFKYKLPIEQYSIGCTEISLTKKNNKVTLNVVRLV